MIDEINVEWEKSDRLTVAKLSAVKQFNKQDHKSKLMTEKYSLLPLITSLSFPKIDTIPVKHREYYNLLLARAQLVGNMLLEWRTKQALEYKSRVKKF